MDWMPRKRSDRYLWWKNLSDKIAVEGPKFGLPPAEITATQAVADAQVAAMEATDAAKDALDGARSAEETALAQNEADIRNRVRGWRTIAAFSGAGSDGELRTIGSDSGFDRNTFKPTLKVSIVGGQIKIDFVKSECDSVAVYCRPRGTIGWTRIGTDSRTPYYDTAPLANPAVPETREYVVRGIIDDIEIGVLSDIVSITLS